MCLAFLKQAAALAFLAVAWPDSGEGHRPDPLGRGGELWNTGQCERERETDCDVCFHLCLKGES